MAQIRRGKLQRGDLALYDGRNSTVSRVDATGGTQSGLPIGNEVDVLQTYGSGTSRTAGTIAVAVSRIGSGSTTLVFSPGTWTIDVSLTIPSNFTCHIPAGCVFDVDSGKTLTIAGPTIIEAETWSSGSGVVSLSRGSPFLDLGDARLHGVAGDGVTDDYAALARWLACGQKRLFCPAGTYLLSTDTVLTVPTGTTIECEGPLTIFKRASGTADIFTTTGSNVTFRNFRMEGPDNTTVDGISTDGGTDILIEDIEGYQLASTVTIGLTTLTDRVTVRNIDSEDNAQQGVHLNKATRFSVINCRARTIGTTNLHHGLYIGNCSDGFVDFIDSEACAGFGLHIFAQSSYNMRRVVAGPHIKCSGCGTAASGNRGGMLVARDSTSTLKGVTVHTPTTYNNVTAGLWLTSCDDITIFGPDEDGNADTTTNGLYVEVGAGHASTSNVQIIGGRVVEHGSNIRLVAPAGTTLNVWLNGTLRIEDADAGGSAGVFGNGAGTINLVVGKDVRFNNNTTNISFSPTAGTLIDRREYEGSTTYDPPSLADGAGTTTTVTVTGATLGDFVEVAFTGSMNGMTMTGFVSTTDTVGVRIQNETVGTLDLNSGTLSAKTVRRKVTI